MSVSGVDGKDKFTENTFYIGQNYKINPYIQTKFQAELLIYKAIKSKGLKANLYRVGNLTWRFEDGKYQYNLMDNAFFLRLKTIYDLSICTETISKYEIDLTPVDLAANKIVSIITDIEKINNIYHIYNNNVISFKEIIEIINIYDRKIRFVTDKEFIEHVELYDSKYNIVLNDISGSLNKINQNITNEKTNLLLGKDWPKVDESYMKNVFKYLEGRIK